MNYLGYETLVRGEGQHTAARWLLTVVLTVGAILVLVKAAHLGVREAQVEAWACTPPGAVLVASSASTPPVNQALRPHRPRPHVPPTWQQERDWARAELQALCRRAHPLVGVVGLEQTRLEAAPGRAQLVVGRSLVSALRRVPQEEVRIRSELDHARGLGDVLAARKRISRVDGVVVRRAESWLQMRRMSATPASRRPPS
jgi:hypothetical protein